MNEEENLPILYKELIQALEKLRRPFEIILNDDGSTDRGGQIADDLAKKDKRIIWFDIEQKGYENKIFAYMNSFLASK
jgi:glycosyltransferase involved in cell wall biosynthesis